MGKPGYRKLQFPILSILSHKEFIIVSGGSDLGENTANKIVIYHKNTVLTHPLYELSTGKDVIQNLTSNGESDFITCNSGRSCIIFSVDNLKSSLKEVARFITDKDSQNANILNSKGDIIITGGDDSIVKVWGLSLESEKMNVKKNVEIKNHTGKILHLDISVDDLIGCSTSEDGTCGIFEIKTGAMLKKLSFSEDTLESNLKFSYCYFARDNKYMFTIQNPKNSGSSYLTKWKIEDNFEPEKTINLHHNAVTASCFGDEGLFMGVGTIDGASKIINTRYFEIDTEMQIHDVAVESVSFVNDSRALASVCRDKSFYFLANVRPEGWFSKISKIWVASMFIIYFIMFFYKNIYPGSQ